MNVPQAGESVSQKGGTRMISLLVAILLAALAWWLCVMLGLPSIVGIIAAVLVLLGGVGTGGIGARSWR